MSVWIISQNKEFNDIIICWTKVKSKDENTSFNNLVFNSFFFNLILFDSLKTCVLKTDVF